MRSLIFVTLMLCATAGFASGPYVTNQVMGINYCSGTTCQQKTPLGYTFEDVPAAQENPNVLRTCACYDQEGYKTSSPRSDTVVTDSTGDIWVVGGYDVDALCDAPVPPGSTLTNIVVRRFNSNGMVDTGWSATNDGQLLTFPGATIGGSSFLGAVVDVSQNLYIALGVGTTVEIAKWNSTGVLQTAFGGNGTGVKNVLASDFPSIPLFNPRSGASNANNPFRIVNAGGSDKLFLVGENIDTTTPFTNSGIWVVRLFTSGSYDTNFGEFAGANFWSKADLGITHSHRVGAPAVSVNGTKLVFAFPKDGSFPSNTQPIIIARLKAANVICTSDATCLDSTIGGDGLVDVPVTNDLSTTAWSVTDFDVDVAGDAMAILIHVVTSNGNGDHELYAYKLTASTETLVNAFSGDGRALITTALGSADNLNGSLSDRGEQQIVADNGGIYLAGAGADQPLPAPARNGWVMRLTSGGIRDTAFGTSNGELAVPGLMVGAIRYVNTVNGFASRTAFAIERYQLVDEVGNVFCGEP